MGIYVYGSTSGNTLITAASAAGNNTLTLNDRTGITSNGEILLFDGGVGGVSAYTWTGIPTWATKVRITHYNMSVSGDGGGRHRIRVGYGSVNSAGNYQWQTCYGGSCQQATSDAEFRLTHADHSSSGHYETGIFRLYRNKTYGWTAEWQAWDRMSNLSWRMVGIWDAADTPIDRVQWFTPFGVFDSTAYCQVYYS